MKYHIYEDTFIHPGNHKLIRRFKGHEVVSLDQTLGLVHIGLNYMPARAKNGEIVDIVNRALTDFNLPGVLYYGGPHGQEIFHLQWITHWNWKNFAKGELEVSLKEVVGPDPQAVALGIKEEGPSNNYEVEPVAITLTREDWTEIYYALEYKRDDSLSVHGDRDWIAHLDHILNTIGPDGDIAAASGVQTNG